EAKGDANPEQSLRRHVRLLSSVASVRLIPANKCFLGSRSPAPHLRTASAQLPAPATAGRFTSRDHHSADRASKRRGSSNGTLCADRSNQWSTFIGPRSVSK